MAVVVNAGGSLFKIHRRHTATTATRRMAPAPSPTTKPISSALDPESEPTSELLPVLEVAVLSAIGRTHGWLCMGRERVQ